MSFECVGFFSDLEAFSIGNVIAEAEATDLGGLWGRRLPNKVTFWRHKNPTWVPETELESKKWRDSYHLLMVSCGLYAILPRTWGRDEDRMWAEERFCCFEVLGIKPKVSHIQGQSILYHWARSPIRRTEIHITRRKEKRVPNSEDRNSHNTEDNPHDTEEERRLASPFSWQMSVSACASEMAK